MIGAAPSWGLPRGLRYPGDVLDRCRPLLLACVSMCMAACGEDSGIVELDWQFVDGTADGSIRPSCALEGRLDGETVPYDMRVRLRVSETTDGCTSDDPACEVASETFGCERRRGALVDIPASDDPYLMRVDVLVEPEGADAFVPNSSCLAVPGPRTRTVTSGKITDLAVYELVVHAVILEGDEAKRMDLEACNAGP